MGCSASIRSGRGYLLVPLALFAVLSAIVLLRLHDQPMQPYGTDAAHYIEHSARLDLVKTLREADFGLDGSGSLRSFIEDLDGSFPPLLHLLTAAVGSITSHSERGILWTGLIWLWLLAAALAGVAYRLSGSCGVSAAAFCAAALLPAAHASATRYYYDLPMTALLWLMVWAVLALRQRAVIAALCGGGLLFAACITKWTALPFGLLMLAGACLCPQPSYPDAPNLRLRGRLMAALAPAALAGVTIAIFLDLAGNHDSFTAMLGDIGERGEIWGPQGVDTGRIAAIIDHIFRDMQPMSPQRLRFYGVRIITSVFSPGLFALMAAMSALWLLRSRRGWPLIGCTVVGQGAFLLLRIPPTDERFVLTLAPALALAGVLGWATLPARSRGAITVICIALGLAVAVDFHLSVGDADSGPQRARGAEELSELMVWGLNDSSDQRGWARRDQQRDNRDEQREALWLQLAGCEANLFKLAAERSLISDPAARGDLYWLRFRSRLSEIEEGGKQRRVLLSCDEAHQDEIQAVLSAVRPGAEARRPRCISSSKWQLESLIDSGPTGQQIALWSRNNQRICPDL